MVFCSHFSRTMIFPAINQYTLIWFGDIWKFPKIRVPPMSIRFPLINHPFLVELSIQRSIFWGVPPIPGDLHMANMMFNSLHVPPYSRPIFYNKSNTKQSFRKRTCQKYDGWTGIFSHPQFENTKHHHQAWSLWNVENPYFSPWFPRECQQSWLDGINVGFAKSKPAQAAWSWQTLQPSTDHVTWPVLHWQHLASMCRMGGLSMICSLRVYVYI